MSTRATNLLSGALGIVRKGKHLNMQDGHDYIYNHAESPKQHQSAPKTKKKKASIMLCPLPCTCSLLLQEGRLLKKMLHAACAF